MRSWLGPPLQKSLVLKCNLCGASLREGAAQWPLPAYGAMLDPSGIGKCVPSLAALPSANQAAQVLLAEP